MTSWKRKLRMGMVGGGQGAFIGAVHRLCAQMDGQVELVAGCFSRDRKNTETTGRQLYLAPERCYADYASMAEAESKLPADQRIDFVAIVTPNASHYDIARVFLAKGFHVACDKPMTYDLPQAIDLEKLVRKSGLVFALTHNYTGNALVREARELFRQGEMGDLRKVIVEYVQDFLAYPHEKEGQKQALWRVDPKQSGLGGTLGDVGTHAFNLLEYITGRRVTELCADKSTFLPDRALDEDANILVRLEGGGKGVITVSQIATGEENALRIRAYGSKGAVTWDQENPNYLQVWRYGKPRETYTRASGYLTEGARAVGRIPTGHPEGYLEAFANVYAGFSAAVRAHLDGKPLPPASCEFPGVHEGVRGMEFITRAVESADAGSVWKKLAP